MKSREVNRKIETRGGVILRQRGSHRFYEVKVEGKVGHTTVPQHAGDIPKGLLRAIERDLEEVLGKGWWR